MTQSLRDRIGVCVHIGRGPYSPAVVEAVLAEIGIVHVRDVNPAAASLSGVSAHLICPNAAAATAAIKAGATSIEVGPNEANAGGKAGWADTLRANAAAIYKVAHGQVPIVAPGLSKWVSPDYAALGDLSSLVDVGNAHIYLSGKAPTDAGAGADQVGAQVAKVAPFRPWWVTETGWNNGTAATGKTSVTPAVAAAQLVPWINALLAGGPDRIYLYELLDEDQLGDPGNNPEANFGLATADGNLKPIGYALQSLLAL